MLISKYYLSLIDKHDLNDPIRKIIIPSIEELDSSGEYDTSGEAENTKELGLQHKYSQTALVLSTNQCAGYCRFCFRKRFVGLNNNEILNRFDKALEYIISHNEIDNVLISGGDSLVLSTKVIEKFVKGLIQIPHLKYIRFGSRVPVFNPDRINNDVDLLKLFARYSMIKNIYVITHFNHPNEITKKSRLALSNLVRSGVKVYNQTVLLKGINDDSNTLAILLNLLIENGVLPYYIFQCRPVARVKNHFQIPIIDGIQVFENAKKQLKSHILCKRLKYVMSHKTGKIEIIGLIGDEVYFKYHQAKNAMNLGKMIKAKINPNGTWLEDFEIISKTSESDINEQLYIGDQPIYNPNLDIIS